MVKVISTFPMPANQWEDAVHIFCLGSQHLSAYVILKIDCMNATK